MADHPNPPKSPTLLPPRKSVELEDPGAHELEHSENEDEVFSDAPEGQGSRSEPSSPIPLTRVERVDDRDNHGEVPGTAAYKMREQDAVPDELKIIPEGSNNSPNSTLNQKDPISSPTGMPIPKTVVEKVDAASPSHGDVPRTAAHSIRSADAVPDVILQVPGDGEAPHSDNQIVDVSPETPIPTTVITKVDSEPSHGEVPGTDAFEIRKGDAKPDIVEKKGDVSGASPIAADGGFGPMDDDESNDESAVNDDDDDADDVDRAEDGEDFGEDFDDFEAGAENEDFGDFDNGFQGPPLSRGTPEVEPIAQSIQSAPPSASPFTTKMLCTTTEAALSNMTYDELRDHVKKLESLTVKASEVLEYWLKRRDSALGDKEAFEGVIENLVKHARKVRK
ncbi:hypothetical protein P7C71_g4996, partial [Lecanoromycetidae sp. Uapishka_2]